ncbi:hypothetical protein TSUD_392660 [Trifolium subterraneum]|uniref:Uncharacterized protein n=1 Tax=Trifolium subterraneum TaxID=3900 RepID=A0A2Z6MKY3_TRISU|nr:hypothetical protein TSUD_392660 [Trifolium subterraneum]
MSSCSSSCFKSMATNNSSSSIGRKSSCHRHPSSNLQQKRNMNVVGSRWTIATLACRCDEFRVLRTAKTITNYGHKFWGSRNYKGPHDVGRNYFDWLDKVDSSQNDVGAMIEEIEKLVDEKNLKMKEYNFNQQEKDMKIASQRKKIY